MMSARFSPTGDTYATGADDATVRIWQTFPPNPNDNGDVSVDEAQH